MEANQKAYKRNCLDNLAKEKGKVVARDQNAPMDLRRFKAYEYVIRSLRADSGVLQVSEVRDLVSLVLDYGIIEKISGPLHTKLLELQEKGIKYETISGIGTVYGLEDRMRLIEVGCFTRPWGRQMANDLADALNDFVRGNIAQKRALPKDLLAMQIQRLQDLFGLSDLEMELFMLIFFKSNNRLVEYLFYNLSMVHASTRSPENIVELARPISIITGISHHDVQRLLGPRGNLINLGLVAANGDLVPDITSFLNGGTDVPLEGAYFNRYRGEALDMDSHELRPAEREILLELLSSPTRTRTMHILFHGVPGTGKTALARTLSRELGLACVEISQNEDAMQKYNKPGDTVDANTSFRYRALAVAQKIAVPEQSIYVIDECDPMLGMEKTQINKILDSGKGCFIWIANSIAMVHQSTLRRFDFSLEFRAFNKRQRQRVWQEILRETKLDQVVPEAEVERLAQNYKINAGGIQVALKNIPRLSRSVQAIPDLLDAHVNLLGHSSIRKPLAQTDSTQYRLDAVEIHRDLQNIVQAAQQFYGQCEASGNGQSSLHNMTILLYGPPGTGKTEFAKYLANACGRSLNLRRVSDIQDKYVGESEKNIRKAFLESEQDGSILFFDEADSFLGNRDRAQHSWEVSQVNEMLSQMEAFKGVVVCATNFEGELDPASRRRFHFKVEFGYLQANGKRKLWEGYFGELDAAAEVRLLDLPKLAPGDFKAAFMRLRFRPSEDRRPRDCIAALEEEVKAKDASVFRKMGF
jgi:SpoVK/Ycf46/Vps4 family AAA+-type ATPase